MNKNWFVVNPDGKLENTIVWDGAQEFSLDDGYKLVEVNAETSLIYNPPVSPPEEDINNDNSTEHPDHI